MTTGIEIRTVRGIAIATWIGTAIVGETGIGTAIGIVKQIATATWIGTGTAGGATAMTIIVGPRTGCRGATPCRTGPTRC
jgi:hypothetical protein